MEWIQTLTIIASLIAVVGITASILNKRIDDTNGRIDDLRVEFMEFRKEVKKEIEELRKEVKEEFKEIRSLLYKVLEVPEKKE